MGWSEGPRVQRSKGPLAIAFLTLLATAPCAAPPDLLVSVWYRGNPKQEELAGIRALGFSAVTWPGSQTAGLETMRKMTADIGLRLIVADPPKPTTPAALLNAPERVDLVVTQQNAAMMTALAWRAVAHGAREIAFDGGAIDGAGLENPDRSLKPWAKAALGVARQFTANGKLIQILEKGPGVIVAPAQSPALDVVMLDADRSWVLIATNASPVAATATVRLPSGAPYAIWLDLLDATTLAMNGEAAGPRWSLKMAAGATHVYLIDKVMK
jgi:hypothetical protein